MPIAVIKFKDNDQLYHFKCDILVGLDDAVVVDTKFGLAIGRVADVIKKSDLATKWVVQKIDLDAYREKLAKEHAREQAKRQRELVKNSGEIGDFGYKFNPEEKTLVIRVMEGRGFGGDEDNYYATLSDEQAVALAERILHVFKKKD